MIQFISTKQSLVESWRNNYFDSLGCSQDMHSEYMITWMPGATFYIININNTTAGHFILNKSNELVEFYICDNMLAQKEFVFSEIVEKFGIKGVYCKSFDNVLLSCCHKFSNSSKLVGYLFQDYNIEPDIVLDDTINIRIATTDDIMFLNSFENELLEEGETIDHYVKNNSVYMFMKEDQLVGCGYLFNVINGRKYYDVGMWVNQAFRKKGYATQIISYLMKHCIDNGFIPTAGCAEDNIASERTLKKCGFVSKYCLIYFEL